MSNLFSKIIGIQLTTVSNPPAGKRVLYAKSDGWYDKNSAGTEIKLVGVAGGQTAYRATLTGSNGAIAVPAVSENQFSAAIVWAYSAEGVYTGTLVGAFPATTTFSIGIGTATGGVIAKIVRTSADVVTLSTFAVDGTTASDFIGTIYVSILADA
jgi:hypothetical protein